MGERKAFQKRNLAPSSFSVINFDTKYSLTHRKLCYPLSNSPNFILILLPFATSLFKSVPRLVVELKSHRGREIELKVEIGIEIENENKVKIESRIKIRITNGTGKWVSPYIKAGVGIKSGTARAESRMNEIDTESRTGNRIANKIAIDILNA
ncbi:hypothetical protein EVAR_36691_1 [Eumeta japonica]|uniref:Uncharacterized protein n=1 Tax=Eumeta variegata TaxID=151549 RepID=A0A4C1XTC1_EUMVA|nr:hypothetical protein EVAR_36691_1 [Eumeta japonica]